MTSCDQCKGLGYYDDGHENDDGTMSGGNYVECEKCKPKNQFSPDWNQHTTLIAYVRELEGRNAELESHMQGLSNEMNDFQNTIERQRLCIARLVDESLIASQAKRLALELECLLNDTQDMAKVSKWWDSAMEALQLYRDACSVAYSGEQK